MSEKKLLNNQNKILLMAFLFLTFIGLCGGSLGIIIVPVAESFGIKTSQVASTFSIFSLGSTLFIISSTGVILKYISVRKTVILTSILLGLGAISIFMADGLTMFYAAMLFFGFGVGMSFALGQYFVFSSYDGKERNSKVALVNFFYSLGAVISPIIGAYLINTLSIPWQFIFTGTALVILFNVLLALNTDFSLIEAKKSAVDDDKAEKAEKNLNVWEEIKSWPITVWIVALSVFLYSMSEVTLTTWLVPYSQEAAGVSPVVAGGLFSTFWLFVGIGRFGSTFILKKISAEVYLTVVSACTSIFVFAFIMSGDAIASYASIMMALLGLGFSALLNVISSYGTLQVPNASKNIVTLFVGTGSVGPIVAPLVSSAIQENFGYTDVMISSSMWMALVTILLLISIVINKNRNYDPYSDVDAAEVMD